MRVKLMVNSKKQYNGSCQSTMAKPKDVRQVLQMEYISKESILTNHSVDDQFRETPTAKLYFPK